MQKKTHKLKIPLQRGILAVKSHQMSTPQNQVTQQQQAVMRVKNSGLINYTMSPLNDEKEEEMTRSALSAFRAKEEEIERKKAEVREKVEAQMGRVEEETKKLAEIREELEALADPMRKEVGILRKKIDLINRDLKPMSLTCQKKEKEYKEVLEAYNEKSREKAQMIGKMMELVTESEKMRLKKLEELIKNIEHLK